VSDTVRCLSYVRKTSLFGKNIGVIGMSVGEIVSEELEISFSMTQSEENVLKTLVLAMIEAGKSGISDPESTKSLLMKITQACIEAHQEAGSLPQDLSGIKAEYAEKMKKEA